MINGSFCSEPSGGTKAFTQGNGDTGTGAARSNGYTCRACSQLSASQDALSGLGPSLGPTSRVYSRDRTQKRKCHALQSRSDLTSPSLSHRPASAPPQTLTGTPGHPVKVCEVQRDLALLLLSVSVLHCQGFVPGGLELCDLVLRLDVALWACAGPRVAA